MKNHLFLDVSWNNYTTMDNEFHGNLFTYLLKKLQQWTHVLERFDFCHKQHSIVTYLTWMLVQGSPYKPLLWTHNPLEAATKLFVVQRVDLWDPWPQQVWLHLCSLHGSAKATNLAFHWTNSGNPEQDVCREKPNKDLQCMKQLLEGQRGSVGPN